MNRFILSLSLILFGLSFGYFIQYLYKSGYIKTKYSLKEIQRFLTKVALLFLNPIALIGALWMVQFEHLNLVFLPFIGLTALLLGGSLAYLIGKKLQLKNIEMGVFIVGGFSTNIGTIGGMICFIFLGEVGFALVPLYKIFEELTYYGIAFPIAKGYSQEKQEKSNLLQLLKKVFSDIFIIVALTSIILGLTLNFSGIERPSFYSSLNTIVIPTTTILLLIAIGLNLEFSKMKSYLKPSFLIVVIKIILVPLAVTSIAYLFGLGQIQNGLPLKVVFILSSMPTGFISMVPANLYNLDKDLSNTIWFMTNMSLIFTIPWIAVVLSIL